MAGDALFLNVLFVYSAYTKQLIFTSGFMAFYSSHCYGGSLLYELRPVAENEDDGKIDHRNIRKKSEARALHNTPFSPGWCDR